MSLCLCLTMMFATTFIDFIDASKEPINTSSNNSYAVKNQCNIYFIAQKLLSSSNATFLRNILRGKKFSLANSNLSTANNFHLDLNYFFNQTLAFGSNTTLLRDFFNSECLAQLMFYYPKYCTFETMQVLSIALANIISSSLALIGNGLVISCAVIDRKKLTSFRHLIAGLAVSDFTFATIQLMLFVPMVKGLYGVYDPITEFLFTTLHASAHIAIGFILVIAIERYHGIVHFNLRNILGIKKLIVFIVLNITSGVLSVVPTYTVRKWNGMYEIYVWFLISVYFILPSISITILYTKTIMWLRKNYANASILNDQQHQVRLKENKRIFILLSSKIAIFAILLLPKNIAENIPNKLYCISIREFQINTAVAISRFIGEVLFGLHCAVNPIIYSLVDRKYMRRAKVFVRHLKELFFAKNHDNFENKFDATYVRSKDTYI